LPASGTGPRNQLCIGLRFLGVRCQIPTIDKVMAFHISKGVDGHAIWLTAIFPAIKWGPPEQALAFRTRRLAQQALARLPTNVSRGAKIVDGGTA
jgi:hypothetical protein